MIIEQTHKKLHHGETAITVTVVRQVYWIPTIRQQIRSILRRCAACARAMGNLTRRLLISLHFPRAMLDQPHHSL